ncbi:MAG: hypothetical protein KGY80_10145 [Candidatus Thorarchaeota archaeon]|nr:hypothetical protein [Candidatus Thorarchaeota archaeon]
MEIPILSGIITGLKTFFKTRRYVAYLIVFVTSIFLSFFVSFLLSFFAGTSVEVILVNVFVYLGATGTIYFMLGSLFTGLGLDSLWITRRARGRATELKGVAWISVSFFISVFLSIFVGRLALLFFAVFCWVGWIAFQAYLSARTSLRLATISEPKKGGLAMGLGSFVILLIGLGLIAAEAIAALYLIPNNILGIGTFIESALPLPMPNAMENIQIQYNFVLLAYAFFGLFALAVLAAFVKYGGRGAALNISLLTVFVAVYGGYFLFNILRRTEAPTMTVVDIGMSFFFLIYAMSGIGRTVTETVEDSRSRLRDFGPLFTFFLASGFFFVDSIIAVTADAGSMLSQWFFADWDAAVNYATFIFRDVAKLMAFPVVSMGTVLYYLKEERLERIISQARTEGESFEKGEVDEEILEAAPEKGEAWPSEHARGIEEGKPGHDLSSPDSDRLSVDRDKARFKPGKRLGEEEEEEE